MLVRVLKLDVGMLESDCTLIEVCSHILRHDQ